VAKAMAAAAAMANSKVQGGGPGFAIPTQLGVAPTVLGGNPNLSNKDVIFIFTLNWVELYFNNLVVSLDRGNDE
jgi:hypothetical protein